ncbi:TerC family protein [Paenibacillus sediminis]|uniref:YjbE family integral membrane protein n=1 Tax=Paenibacillus sediminis TaxID=664909 RepID=A0ABS4GYR5_9BACL|nr:YjbE family integral membrane protein [Paenibacillus sediminis]
MELFSGAFLLSLLNIIFIDLILAGDNAIVIGLAARNLPASQQKKAIIYGTGGAVAIRILATVVVLELLKIPLLLAIGGILLIWIAYKLLTDEGDHSDIKAGGTLWAAIRTIIVADAAMGLDNVIAVAGAAKGHLLLVVLGLMVSVPIVVWGSTIFIKLTNRFPWIIYFGSGILAYTASNMITEEKRLEPLFDQPVIRYVFIVLVIASVLLAGYMKQRKQEQRKQSHDHSYS